MTDAEYILALEGLIHEDPPDMQFLHGLGCTRRFLRAHVEDWWERRIPKADVVVRLRQAAQAEQARSNLARIYDHQTKLEQEGILCRQCVSERIGMPEKGLCTCGHGSLLASGVQKVHG